uniref:Adrenal ferredoxin n=1 Tax=Meleagris gallopavo TaxID=9103 RepID=A0A803Y4S7_MELGA
VWTTSAIERRTELDFRGNKMSKKIIHLLLWFHYVLFFFSSEDKITVHFINRDGDKLTAKGKPGDSLLDVVVDNNLDIDGFGACEGTLACSTCHLIFEDHIFEKLDAITDEEMDMLDLAYGLTETSRLGCQICLKKSMDNMTVRVPEAVADARQSVDLSKNS